MPIFPSPFTLHDSLSPFTDQIKMDIFLNSNRFRNSLRNPKINYRCGWWAMTVCVAYGRPILAELKQGQIRPTELGRLIEQKWLAMSTKYNELEIHDYVVMPDHFHAILHIYDRPTNHKNHLGFLMGRFKGSTSHVYNEFRREKRVEDIGPNLWQRDYWDKLLVNETELQVWQQYIRENPKNWQKKYGD